MNIVILDAGIINPDGISWQEFEALGSVQVYAETAPKDVVQRAQDAEILIINKVRITEEILAKLPKLRYLGLLSTGFDVIDIEAAAKRQVPVCNVVAYSPSTVAQHVMAMVLELTRHLNEHSKSVKSGDWTRSGQWCYWLRPIRDLGEMRMGIVGFGNIGREVGRMAHALGMEVQAYSRSPKESQDYPCNFVSLQKLLATSDVISLHCPLTEQTRNLINIERLVSMRPGAILINTARGALVDELAVAAALHSGELGGMGTDVLSTEPPQANNPLFTAPNCIITPHISWATQKARASIIHLTAANVAAWLKGAPKNVVNGVTG